MPIKIKIPTSEVIKLTAITKKVLPQCCTTWNIYYHRRKTDHQQQQQLEPGQTEDTSLDQEAKNK